ncbi:MAG: ABC transporter ATP-binding protein [Verrucomicrobiota bacterium]
MSEALRAINLSKRFDTVTAVDGVCFGVNYGEVVGLLGPNGAGKTTTLRMLAGILTPTSGQVLVQGCDLQSNPLAAKQRMGFLSGDTQLYQRLTPREVLEYFGRLYGLDEVRLARRIAQVCEELEMSAFADRPCRTLSSGQKQRANIARAFLHEPEVLILDEPTSALDVISGQFIIAAIRRQRAAGRAILFSTHIMGEAEYLCDRICLIHEGRIADQGRLDEILAHSGCTNLTDAFLWHAHNAASTGASPAKP